MASGGRRFAPKVLGKYLERYAEPDEFPPGLRTSYQRVLVVPAFREVATFISGYENAASRAPGRTLCVIVVNQAPDCEAALNEVNLCLLKDLVPPHAVQLSQRPPQWLVSRDAMDLWVIARTHGDFAIPRTQGVGLARKVGVDLALQAYARGLLESSWIHMTDADATLSDDYFLFQPAPDSAALCYPFRHSPGTDAAVHSATLAYEVEMRFRVLGLAWAGCPYAFHTIGSCLAVHGESYAAVRGMPKRAAGEDFHLLNKLAKVGPIEIPDTQPVQLRSRHSNRVPFGTGPRVRELVEAPDSWTLDSPACFDELSHFLGWLTSLDPSLSRTTPEELGQLIGQGRGASLWKGVLNDLSFDEFRRETARRNPDARQFRDHAATWFDGLRAQQLLHRLRSDRHPRLPLMEALTRAPFVPEALAIQNTNYTEMTELLAQLEAQLPTRRGPRQ